MNHRIQELRRQVKLDFTKFQDPESFEKHVKPLADLFFHADSVLFDEFVEKFAELIVQECIDICENVAADADATANSDMVTDAGRMLHQGMYGGAKSCGGIIKHRLGVES